jgi:hypothetical protein
MPRGPPIIPNPRIPWVCLCGVGPQLWMPAYARHATLRSLMHASDHTPARSIKHVREQLNRHALLKLWEDTQQEAHEASVRATGVHPHYPGLTAELTKRYPSLVRQCRSYDPDRTATEHVSRCGYATSQRQRPRPLPRRAAPGARDRGGNTEGDVLENPVESELDEEEPSAVLASSELARLTTGLHAVGLEAGLENTAMTPPGVLAQGEIERGRL